MTSSTIKSCEPGASLSNSQQIYQRYWQCCDYFSDQADRFWIVGKNTSPSITKDKGIAARLVYESMSESNHSHHPGESNAGSARSKARSNARELNGKLYQKVISLAQNQDPVYTPLDQIVRVYEPRSAYAAMRNSLPAPWYDLAAAIESAGVQPADIGIFGSTLLGFDIQKDVDYVVYGRKNHDKVFAAQDTIRAAISAGRLTGEHMSYNLEKKLAPFSPQNSWRNIFARRWSSLQLGPGVASTIRFVYEPGEEPRDLWRDPVNGSVTIDGMVVESLSDFQPAQCRMATADGNVDVAFLSWYYQSCVKIGDMIRVHGHLRSDSNKPNLGIQGSKSVTVDLFSHYLSILFN